MILTGAEIEKQVRSGTIIINPFRDEALNPNSYDLRLGDELLVYESDVLDVARRNNTRTVLIPDSGMRLRAGKLYLGSSAETVGSDHYVPVLHGKSGTARAGLFVHVTANLIDLGSVGRLTFQLAPVLDVVVRPGWPLAQVSFWQPVGDRLLYQGKYAGSTGPRASESFRDWAGAHDER